MKVLAYAFLATGAVLCGCRNAGEKRAGGEAALAQAEAGKRVAQVVDAGCGMCIFNMPDASCQLAVKIDGKVYRVEGSKLDDHGDAHAPDGMCMVARKAYIEGRIEGDKFIASKVVLRK